MLAIMFMATPMTCQWLLCSFGYTNGYTLDYAQVTTIAATPMAMPMTMCTTMPTSTLHSYACANATRLHPQTIFMVACSQQKVTVSSSFFAPDRSSLPSIFVYKT